MNCLLNLLAKKKKKPKLLNKFDKTIKAELDAAEKLRKKVSFECFTQDCRQWTKNEQIKNLEKGRMNFRLLFVKLAFWNIQWILVLHV